MDIELPDGTVLDAPDDLPAEKIKAIVQKHTAAAKPRVGMGDVQAAVGSRVAPAGNANVPAGLLTGDPATDDRIGQNMATQGYTRPISGRDVAQAGAIGLGTAAGLATGAPVIGGAISSALTGAGLSKAPDALGVAGDATISGLLGAGFGGAAKGIGALASKAAGWAGQKVGGATAKILGAAAENKDAEVRSLEAAARERAANAYRQMERIELALSNKATSAADRTALEAFKQTPEYADLVAANAKGILSAAPEAAAERAAAQQVAQQARQELPQAIQTEAERLGSPAEARHQVWERVKRYGPVAIGSAVGAHIGGPIGIGIGSLAGAGTRPMVRALGRMVQNPAVQRQYLGWLESAAGATASRAPAMTRIAAPVAATAENSVAPAESAFLDWLRARASTPRLAPVGAAGQGETE